MFRVVFVAALALISLPAVAGAQNVSVDSLLRRIEVLERSNADLDRRIRQLESLIRNGSSRDRPLPSTANWRDLQNWRQLRRGMTMDEVRALLGEPQRVQTFGGAFTLWQWNGGSADVRFDGSSGKVDAWSEPSR